MKKLGVKDCDNCGRPTNDTGDGETKAGEDGKVQVACYTCGDSDYRGGDSRHCWYCCAANHPEDLVKRRAETGPKNGTEEERMAQESSKALAAKLTAGNAVNREVEKIGVPAGMLIKDAISVLEKEMEYEEQTVSIKEEIPGSLWDAAYAVLRAMERRFGWVHAQPGFFGDPPQMFSIPSGVGATVNIPWGEFKVPGITGTLALAMRRDRHGRAACGLVAEVKRKFEPIVKALAEEARAIVRAESLYRGKAVRVKFPEPDPNGRPAVITPEFMDVSKAREDGLILSNKVARAVSTSVFAPIKFAAACREHGIPLKRGVLLSGMYGTGKTLTAYVAAKLCEDAGRTFVYVEAADQLAEALAFAREYQPALVFCEDIDRTMSGERDADADEILNILDGVDTKDTDLMVILTTNNVGSINRAMIRPGRLDDVIEFTPPDMLAVERLIRHYGGEAIPPNADLAEISEVLEGNIPAVIRECVERSKLSAIKLAGGQVAPGALTLSPEALLDAADTMAHQLGLLAPRPAGLGAHEAVGRLLESLTDGTASRTRVLITDGRSPAMDSSEVTD